MKTIGVLGGIGPQATMDFVARLHEEAQKHIPPQANSGYPPLLVYYCRFPPVVITKDNYPVIPYRPSPAFLQAAKNLGTLADFLVLTANAPHQFRSQIEEASGLGVLSMIDVTLEELAQKGWEVVGLLGLGEPLIYMQPLAKKGIPYVILPSDIRDRLDQAIIRVMEGRETAQDRLVALQAIERLRLDGADGIILGCTEVPLLLPGDHHGEDLINPAEFLAAAAIRHAMT